MSAQPSVLQVVILRDGLLVGTEVFVPGAYTLGSGRASDLRLDDLQVAEHQATLYFQNGKAAIQDVGGGRGVYVNGHKIRACEIRSVDEVACGPFVLKARVLQQRPAQMALPPEVANLLRATPAGGAPNAVSRSAVSLQSAAQHLPPPVPGSIPLRAVAGTAPSARRLAQAEQPRPQLRPAGSARPLPGADDRSVKVVEGFFQEEHPTYRATAAVPQVQSDPGTGPFQAARALSADGAVVSQPAARPAAPVFQPTVPGIAATPAGHARPELLRADPPTIGVELPEDPSEWELEAPPEPIKDANGIPTGSVVNFQWPSAPPEMEESQPAYVLDEPLAAAPARAAAPPVPPAPVAAPRRAPAVPAAASAVKSAQKLPPPKKGGPRLYFELSWGNQRHKAWSFVPTVKKPVRAGPREDVELPLYGLGLEDTFVLGEQADGDAFKVFVPTGVKIERGNAGGPLSPVAATSLETEDTRRCVTLKNGAAVRLSAGNTSLLAWVAPPPAKEKVSILRQLPILLLLCLIAMGSGAVTFLYKAQGVSGEAGFVPKDLPNVAVRLIAPTPKKKERVKQNLAEMRARAEKRSTPEKAKPAGVKAPKQPEKQTAVAQSKALQAIKKITSGGATGDILSAVSKQGGGSKKTKGYALTGLIGKGVAAPGTGGLGSGGLGKGKGTLGGELLRGSGGVGIGAIGAGGVGKGSVGGTVARATGRAVQSSGDIDRNAVAKVVNDHMNEVQSCYERALLRTPSLAGKVVIEWTIGGVGKVTSVRTKNSTLRSSAVEGCIMNALKKWQFPKPRGGSVIITYPFLFNSVGF